MRALPPKLLRGKVKKMRIVAIGVAFFGEICYNVMYTFQKNAVRGEKNEEKE